MGWLIRRIVRLLYPDWGPRFPAYWTEVSKTFESLPVSATTRWFWGGFLHLGLVALVLLVLTIWRDMAWQNNPTVMAAMLIGCCWAWVGPSLIWYYETRTLPQLDKDIEQIVVNEIHLRRIREFIFSNIYSMRYLIVFTVAWVVVAALAYYRAEDFLNILGIHGHRDPFFWIVGFGVVQVAYYGSIGCCLAYKATLITKLVASSELATSLYRGDGAFGLSFIGKFALKTEWMFISGWLFMPIIVIMTHTTQNYLFIGFIGGAYLVFTVLAFVMPIYIIHMKIVEKKEELVKRYGLEADSILRKLEAEILEPDLKRFELCKKLLGDIREIPNWPVSMDVGVKFLASTVLIPAVAAVVTTVLKSSKFGP